MSIAFWNEVKSIWAEIARINEQLLQLQLALNELKSEKPKGRKSA